MVTTNFLDIPREVRDMIYMYYTSIDGGYVYNADTGKLRPATPCRQHLALQSTCKLLAQEMEGLAVAHNVVSFSTVENMRHRAFLFDFLFDMFCRYESHCLVKHAAKGPITDSTWEYMAKRFPAFTPLINAVKPHIPSIPDMPDVSYGTKNYGYYLTQWRGVATSSNLDFIHVLLQQVNSGGDSCTTDLALHERNWMIPSDEELARMSKDIKVGFKNDVDHEGMCYSWTEQKEFNGPCETDRDKYHFSAAAIAIRFLQCNPTIRLHMRKIILFEDNPSVAFPETHGKGLIPFCAENAQLRIERRVSVWTNVYFAPRPVSSRKLPLRAVSWALEALTLPPAISLVLDGDPATPEISAHNFQKWVIQGAVWQKGFEESYRRQLLPYPGFLAWISGMHEDPSNFDEYDGYCCEDWPQIIQGIIDGSSPISCNFPLEKDFSRDVEELMMMAENLQWSQQDWNDGYQEYDEGLKQPDKALPNWDAHMEMYERSLVSF